MKIKETAALLILMMIMIMIAPDKSYSQEQVIDEEIGRASCRERV